MKTTKFGLFHIIGSEAYQIYWQQYYQCRPKLSTIKAIDLNLEIIIDSEGELLAYRYDHPEKMKWMVINDGQWKIWKERDIGLDVWDELKIIICSVRQGICQN